MSDDPVIFALQSLGLVALVGGLLIGAVLVVATWKEPDHG